MSNPTNRAPVLGSRDIRQVMAVADRGSIRQAAEVLGLTQPGLSKNLRLIEDRLGVVLFERSTTGVKLTLAGQLLVERGRQVLLDLAAIERDIDETTRGHSGQVTVGLGTVIAVELATDLLAETHRLYPGIALDIVVEEPASLLERVRSGRLDFGFFYIEPHRVDGDFLTKEVLRTRPVVLVGRRHPLVTKAEVIPPDLLDYRIAMPKVYPGIVRWLETITGGTLKPALVGSDYYQIGELLERADVYSLVSPGLVGRLQRFFDVVRIPVSGFDFVHSAHSVQAASRPLSGAAQRVMGLALQLMSEPGNRRFDQA
jgi:DNA-binding transcriptional LysR family regulator